MISSTARDLPEHRKEVMDACLRQGMFPIMMEHLPANDDEAISASLKMVDEADIYVGIFAHRYGYIPKGHKISVTEMEYNRAVERKIPRLIFVMDKDHPIKIEDIEMGKGAKKLETFKKKILANNIVNQFKSPAELRAHVINSLSKYLETTPATLPDIESSTIDVTAYFNALRKRYNVLALEGLTPPQKEEYLQIQLRSVFVEQSVREDTPPVELPKEVWEKLSREKEIHEEDLPSGITLDDVRNARESYFRKPSLVVLDALADKSNKYTIILGDPGSGKSTLARYVMLSLIDPALVDEKIQKAFDGYLPLLIELRAFVGACADGKCETPLEFLEHLGKTEGWGLTQSALHNHLKNDGRVVIIFDGLDEIFEPQMRETVTKQIVGFMNAYPKARVIVTSRILGYRRKILSDAGFKHFTLQDLDEKQVETFITKWYELAMSDRLDEAKERSERILKSFKDSPSIRQLAGNPMLLTIMAIIGKHQELPRERWKLYDHAASVLIQHWDVNKHLKDELIEADFIGEDDKKELLRRLAYRMQSGNGGLAGNYIHREGLQEEFESYLKERYNKAPDRAKIIANAMIQQFRERNFILSLYGANLYGFVHRAFLEYFCASVFVWKFEKTKELTIEELKTDVYGKHWEDQSWHEVLRLICGMIDEQWAKKVIHYLVNDAGKSLFGNFDRYLPWNLLLAIDCLTEIRNLNLFTALIEQILQLTCLLLEQNMRGGSPLYNFLSERIFPSIAGISPEIPNRLVIVHWVKNRSPNENTFLMYGELFAQFIASIGYDLDEVRQEIFNYVSSKDANKRLVAVATLSEVWRDDPSVFQIIKELVQNDPDDVVRLTAINCLANYFQDNQQTIDLFWNIAEKESDFDVRELAIKSLAYRYRTNAKVLNFLFSLQESPIPRLREIALKTLGKYYSELPEVRKRLWDILNNKDNVDDQRMVILPIAANYKTEPETFELLSSLLSEEMHPTVRLSTVFAFGVVYRNDPRSFTLLNHLVVHDHDENVRSLIVNILGEDYLNLGLIRNLAVNDSSEKVRSSAIPVLAERFLEDSHIKEFLYNLANTDLSPKAEDPEGDRIYPREVALESILEHWPDHPDTLPLLRERAENDPTPWLRERCKELIKEIEGKKK